MAINIQYGIIRQSTSRLWQRVVSQLNTSVSEAQAASRVEVCMVMMQLDKYPSSKKGRCSYLQYRQNLVSGNRSDEEEMWEKWLFPGLQY
jgi:hypothetical protein